MNFIDEENIMLWRLVRIAAQIAGMGEHKAGC